MKKFATILKIVISLAIILFLLRKANLAQSAAHLSGIRYSFILFSIVFIVAGQFVRAQRLAVMVFGRLANRNFWNTMRIQMISFLPGMITPAKVGELAKVYMLQAEMDVPTARGLACFAAERVFDLLALGPLAALGIFVLFRADLQISLAPGWAHIAALVALAAASAAAVGLLWLRRRGVSLRDFRRTVTPERIIEAALLSLLYWGIVFLEVWCFCKSALFDTPIWHPALVVPPALMSSLVPITFSGFGLREAAMVILFQRPPIATSYERALLISLMYDIIGLGVPALMGGLFWVSGKSNGNAQD
ncbi:flippase-like domain-containing protein [Candidatus Poribacteria bacterium]|nr:flippase-like domain-containing protein [Candidatus Poribacteria bacterium]